MPEHREKKHKSKDDKKIKKASEKESKKTAQTALSLLADNHTELNPTLSSLFAVKQPPIKAKPALEPGRKRVSLEESNSEEANDAELSEIDEDFDDDDDAVETAQVSQDDVQAAVEEREATPETDEETKPKRKRKRKDADEGLEAAYMNRLAREEEKEAAKLAAERAVKRQRLEEDDNDQESDAEDEEGQGGAAKGSDDEDDSEEEEDDDDDEDAVSPPPKHETEQQTDEELGKANRTVFLGNVSTDAITSKASRKKLLNHLGSFFDRIKASDGNSKPAVESLRFRSTAYATAMPKKAAFAKKELMDATTKSTNAYAVYSSQALAREAAKQLNGTVILDRHLRVDEVAHPAKVDHRRCVFVGNLGFVDDESNIQDANEDEGREIRKRGKEPADVEEGLWRSFGKCGKVESVRVIRDSKTRVGKGIAYVQFADENGVEAALLLNEKKFPPMLPRKLRVSRAKAEKRNAKPGSARPSSSKPSLNGYQRKITGEEASKMGRAGKLLGRAAASQVQRSQRPPKQRSTPQSDRPALGSGIKKPESFIFEGHRASSKQGKSGLKLAGKHGKKKTRVTKRSQSFKANNNRKAA